MHVERPHETQKRRRPNFTVTPLDPAHLDRRQACPLGENFLHPSVSEPCRSHIRPELLDDVHQQPCSAE